MPGPDSSVRSPLRSVSCSVPEPPMVIASTSTSRSRSRMSALPSAVWARKRSVVTSIRLIPPMAPPAISSVRAAVMRPSVMVAPSSRTSAKAVIVPADSVPSATMSVSEAGSFDRVMVPITRSSASRTTSGVGPAPSPVKLRPTSFVDSGPASMPTPPPDRIVSVPPVMSRPIESVRSMPCGAVRARVASVPNCSVSVPVNRNPAVPMMRPPPAMRPRASGRSSQDFRCASPSVVVIRTAPFAGSLRRMPSV